MNYANLSKIGLGLFLSTASLFAVDVNNGAKVLETKCIACHTGSLKDGLSRISDQRKTPEGWYMTISRMERLHGLTLTEDEEKDVIKYLSDNQGLTPDEIKPFEYVLDKTPNYQEAKPKDTLFAEMCVRCHSQARIGLQRRTANEWDGLVNFHVAEFISFEGQAQARDRDWFGIAQKKVVPYLAKHYGKNIDKWNAYKASIKDYKLPTSWTFAGHNAKDGDFSANLTLTKAKDDSYTATYEESFLNGKSFKAEGRAILYSGSELRVSLKDVDGKRFQEILHIDPKTSTINGRVYETFHNTLGSELNGVSAKNSKTVISGIFPSAVKSGQKTKLVVVGSNLSNVKLPSGIEVLKTISSSKNKIELEVVAKPVKTAKAYDVKVGSAVAKDGIAIFDKVDYIKVTPDYAVARTGDDNAKIKKEYAQFEAIGFSVGADGKKGTADDIKLVSVPAIWNMKPYDEQAKEDGDIRFAGSINRYTGLYTPSESGYNPTRKLMANNVGNLTITATFIQDNKKLEADAHLISNVPKFVNPPIN